MAHESTRVQRAALVVDEVLDLDAAPPPADASPVAVETRPGDLVSIPLTGGSTGTPKAVPRYATGAATPAGPSLWEGAVQLLCTPIAYIVVRERGRNVAPARVHLVDELPETRPAPRSTGRPCARGSAGRPRQRRRGASPHGGAPSDRTVEC